MVSERVFLTATWRRLILLNYSVPDEILMPYLAPGLTLDQWQGRSYVSLVAFDFRDTNVFGRKWPGHTHFPEINLRFYVRDGERRGVQFIREIVPSRITAAVARYLYGEPYVSASILSEITMEPNRIDCRYRLTWQGKEYLIRARGRIPTMRPNEKTMEHFFKEHEWGFSRNGSVYRVTHPVWEIHPIEAFSTTLDFRAVYGAPWSFLTGTTPESAVLAEGSEIKVFAAAKRR